MNCAEFEILLADYIDGALSASERGTFAGHLETCTACATLTEDALSAVAFMERAAEVEPPPALLASILQATNAGLELKVRGGGFSGWINRMFAPVLQPRIVMSALMTLMTVTMIGQFWNPAKTRFPTASLNPVRLWTVLDDDTNRLWDRAVKGYETAPLVYAVKMQVDDWAEQQREAYEASTQETK